MLVHDSCATMCGQHLQGCHGSAEGWVEVWSRLSLEISRTFSRVALTARPKSLMTVRPMHKELLPLL